MQAFYAILVLIVSFRSLAPWGKAAKTVHLTFYYLVVVTRDMLDIYSIQIICSCRLNYSMHNSTGGGSFRISCFAMHHMVPRQVP